MATPIHPGTLHRFFVRTDSTTVLGCEPAQPCHANIEEALPLACQPHLLHPGARREQLFGTAVEHPEEGRNRPLARSMTLSRSRGLQPIRTRESAADQEDWEREKGEQERDKQSGAWGLIYQMTRNLIILQRWFSVVNRPVFFSKRVHPCLIGQVFQI